MAFTTQSYKVKRDKLEQAIKWLTDSGLNIYSSRIGKYRKDFDLLIEAEESNSIRQLIDKGMFPDTLNSLYESSELISIFEGLSLQKPSSSFKHQLIDFVKGPAFANNESLKTASHKARDVAFELFIASVFSKAGYSIDLTTQTDIIVTDSQNRFYIECKRPHSVNSVSVIVKDANRQLRKRFKRLGYPQNTFGIIALSLDKVINPEHNMLVSADENEVDDMLSNEMTRFVNDNQYFWKRLSSAIGMLLLFQSVGVIESLKIPTTFNYLVASNIIEPDSLEYAILKNLVDSLKFA